MKSIGIMYLCTGPYVCFWKDFYITFEANFLPNTEKHYYVFTDSDSIFEEESSRVHRHYLSPQPWPLVTLLRFHTFLSVREDLEKHDFLMFSNSNIVCDNVVLEEDFLPDSNKGEKMCFTKHPGYFDKPCYKIPYERNPKSTAYIPYHKGGMYVIGAMFCGNTADFLDMSMLLRDNINKDLKKNIIAKWHDESHINHYLACNSGCRILSCSYCYPSSFDLSIEKKLVAVGKEKKFDVNTFKGQNEERTRNNLFIRLIDKIKRCFPLELFCYIRDFVMNKKIKV